MLGDMHYVSVTPIAQAEDSGDRRRDNDLDIGSELLGQAIGNSGAIIGAVRQNASHRIFDPDDEVRQPEFNS